MNQAWRHFEETDLVRTLRQHWVDRIEDMEHLPLRDTAGEVICERIEEDPLSGIGKVLEEQRAGIAVVPHIDDLPPPDSKDAGGQAAEGAVRLEGNRAVVGVYRSEGLKESFAH